MCTHYAVEEQAVAEAAGQLRIPLTGKEIRDRYNVSPSQPTWAARLNDGQRVLDSMRWGFVPRERKGSVYNARSESASWKDLWREAFVDRHCVLPATAYYETPNGTGVAVRRVDGAPLLIAGLWEEHPTLGLCCTMLTTTPNAEVEAVHNRMPVVLTVAEAEEWLACRRDPRRLLRPCDPKLVRWYRVSPDCGNYRHDGAYLLEPLPAE